MILVDTSVIIDFLRNQKNERVALFDDIIEKRIPWGINEYVYQEVLQGSRDEREFEKLREYFDTIPMYFLKYGKVSFERAAMLNVLCRKSGVTIRSTVDLLIAETAIENDVSLLHNDNDFDSM
ncbi:MAG: PIN domain-containing protein, partial [Patescibacteria group bacterium]